MDKINFVNDSEPELSAENLNQMQTNVENAINEIVEVITNENGTAIKYSNGIMICKHKHTGNTFACTANIAGRYYFTDVNNSEGNTFIWKFPASFISTDDLVVNLSIKSNAYTVSSLGYTSTEQVTGYGITPYSVTSCTFEWHFTAIGRWE